MTSIEIPLKASKSPKIPKDLERSWPPRSPSPYIRISHLMDRRLQQALQHLRVIGVHQPLATVLLHQQGLLGSNATLMRTEDRRRVVRAHGHMAL